MMFFNVLPRWGGALTKSMVIPLLFFGIYSANASPEVFFTKNRIQTRTGILQGRLPADTVISGHVTDTMGEALIGVSVKVKGVANLGASTNVNGDFKLSLPDSIANPVLVVSYLGYDTREVPVPASGAIAVQLTSNSLDLQEVVIVGYNVVKKADVTGAVASVGAEEIRSRPVANALEAMQGKAAGVDITSNERPGELGSVLIRGARSINASNTPLYVVDGIPLSSGGIEAINPNDVERIDILKDASATAIYGSRGANGVVLVTTKRGATGGLTLSYAGTVRIETLNDRTRMMNSGQYIEFRRNAYRRAGNYPDEPTQADDQLIFGQDAYAWANVLKGWQNGVWNGGMVSTTDWTGMVKQTGVVNDHTLSVSGGTDKIKAYGSFGFLNQEGTQLGQGYKRYTAKFSTDITPVKWFTMGGSITGTSGNQDYGFSTTNASGPGTLYFAAQGMLPYAVPYDDNGNRINLPGGDINILNPIGEENFNVNQRKTLRALGSLYAQVTFLPGLRYRVNFGPDFYSLRNGRWMDERSINRGGGEPGSTNYAQLSQTYRNSWTLDNLLYYDKTLDKHSFGITLLQSSTSYRQETSTMTATKLPWNAQMWYQLNSVSALDSYGSGLIESSLLSYMARLNYTFDNKYLLTASARWDGASQLAPGHKWDFFPSASIAWRLDQENFLNKAEWINQLKLRFGLGSTGNAAINPYTTEGAVQTLYYTWGSLVAPGYVSSDASLANPSPLPNQDLGWERTTQWNLGIDFDFFRGGISGSLDLYTSRTNDLLLLQSIPSVTGYTTTLANVGATGNRGVDLTLNTRNIRSENFTWSSTLNFSANRDRIIELANGRNDDVNNRWFIGQPLSVYYDFVKDRIWQNTPGDLAEIAKFNANGLSFRPGDIKPKDRNGDYRIDANNDRMIVGHARPDWTGGLTNTFEYKNWQLSVFIFSRWGFTLPTGGEFLQGRYAQRLVDYWTPQNPTNDYPSPNYDSANGDPFRSAMNYQDASFIKVRTLSIGYTLPGSASKKLGLGSVRIYGQVENPGLLYSNVDWIDPDLGGSTFNRGFVLGLNAGF
jgi:TonB-linked SusC/RagA family outer membrane protein